MIEVSGSGSVAILTLARAEKHNALNIELCTQLRGAVDSVVAQGARALVITGDGASFCAGADLDEVYSAEFRDALYAMLQAVVNAPVPVIAAVNGPAIGGGTQLAIAADLRMATKDARFAIPTARLGLAVDPWTLRRLSGLAGNAMARRIVVACESIHAEQALACGLADRSGKAKDAVGWAEQIAEFAPLTLRYSKRALNAIVEPELERRPTTVMEDFEACWASADAAEGRVARSERRPPVFQGR